MQIVVSQVQSNGVPVTVFEISGDIDNRTHEQLENEARAAYDAGSRRLLLDLAGVRYVGSNGLRALHTIFTLFREPADATHDIQQGVRAGTYKCTTLKICGANQPITDVLRVAGYDMFLDLFPTRAAALASFNA